MRTVDGTRDRNRCNEGHSRKGTLNDRERAGFFLILVDGYFLPHNLGLARAMQ
jgi:hypothetical protein